MNEAIEISEPDLDRLAAINLKIPGWSGIHHYTFFRQIMEGIARGRSFESPIRILVLGVYLGRDISYLLDIAQRYHNGRRFEIVGVDKFSAAPCADWPEEKRGLTWEAAGFGPPPSLDQAYSNIAEFNGCNEATLVCASDVLFLSSTSLRFDFVYLDTSHDHETVSNQLRLVPRVCSGDALIAGDDYSDAGTWGVKRAVSEAFSTHHVFANWLWFSTCSALKS